MKGLLHLAKETFKINEEYEAIVVNNADPLFRGRLQVNIVGITNGTNYPWVEVRHNLLLGSNSTIGFSSVPKIGTLVYVGFKLNNPSFPIITGLVRGNQDSSKLHTVQDLNNTIYSTRNTKRLTKEQPPLNNNTTYPNNSVIETSSCVIEIDDTPNNFRVSIQHKNGSHFELRPDGSVQVKADGNEYNIVKGNLEEFVGQAVNKIFTQGATIQSPMTTFMGDVTVTGDIITGGTSFANDHVSGEISGKSHTHPGDSGGTTGQPQ